MAIACNSKGWSMAPCTVRGATHWTVLCGRFTGYRPLEKHEQLRICGQHPDIVMRGPFSMRVGEVEHKVFPPYIRVTLCGLFYKKGWEEADVAPTTPKDRAVTCLMCAAAKGG